jgi:hypothetical protein
MNTDPATIKLTAQSMKLFAQLCYDSGDWSGSPLVDVNRQTRGNLTDLKKAGLIRTVTDEGNVFAEFTDLGYKYAALHGIDVAKLNI